MLGMIMALALMLQDGGSAIPPATCQEGIATRYAYGVFEHVYANRLRFGQVRPCSECVGFAAVRECDRLGERVMVTYRGHSAGPLLVTDCAAPWDAPGMLRRNHIIELDPATWQALGLPDAPARVEVRR